MKKVLGLITIVGFVACTSSETKVSTSDTTVRKDTTVVVPVDTTHHDTTNHTVIVDTVKKTETPAAH